jgi:hypothetical protein
MCIFMNSQEDLKVVQEALHWRDEKYKRNASSNYPHIENTELHNNENTKNSDILLKDLNVSIFPHLLPLDLPPDLPQVEPPVGITTPESARNFITGKSACLVTGEITGKLITEFYGKLETCTIITNDTNQSLKSPSKENKEHSKKIVSDGYNDYDGEYYNEYDRKDDKIHYKNKNENVLTIPSNIVDLEPEALMELVVSFKSAYTNLSQVCHTNECVCIYVSTYIYIFEYCGS